MPELHAGVRVKCLETLIDVTGANFRKTGTKPQWLQGGRWVYALGKKIKIAV